MTGADGLVAVVLNGAPTTLAAGTTVEELVLTHAGSTRGVAVARNAETVARSIWSTTVVADGDLIELLSAAQGG